jgi:hypothetical protein
VQEADNAFYFEPSLTEVTEKLNDEHIDWLEKAAAIKKSIDRLFSLRSEATSCYQAPRPVA